MKINLVSKVLLSLVLLFGSINVEAQVSGRSAPRTLRSPGDATVTGNLTVGGDATVEDTLIANYLHIHYTSRFDGDAQFRTNLATWGDAYINGNVGIKNVLPRVPLEVTGSCYFGGKAAGSDETFMSVFKEISATPGTYKYGQADFFGVVGGANGVYALDLEVNISDNGAVNYTNIYGIWGGAYTGLKIVDNAGSVQVAYTGTVGSLYGIRMDVANWSLGNCIISNAYGCYVSTDNPATGIIRNARGIQIANVKATGVDAGQTHNAYGIYINNNIIASGGATNNTYSIYSLSTASSYLAGALNVNNNLGIRETSPITTMEITYTEPYISLHNSSNEDTDGGRESRIIARGHQSGAEESMLGYSEFSHGGTSDDQKGQFKVYLNDGDDNEAPSTLAIKLGPDGAANFIKRPKGFADTCYFSTCFDTINAFISDTVWFAQNPLKRTIKIIGIYVIGDDWDGLTLVEKNEHGGSGAVDIDAVGTDGHRGSTYYGDETTISNPNIETMHWIGVKKPTSSGAKLSISIAAEYTK